jgi:hypothetical protein
MVCHIHGGRSRGPTTVEGRQRCAEARMTHGQETTEKRKERSKTSAELAVLEEVGHLLGFMTGPRTRGRKPSMTDEVLPELQRAVRKLLLRD